MSSASLIVALASSPEVLTSDGREVVQAAATIQGQQPINVVVRSNTKAAVAAALKQCSPGDLIICSGDVVLDQDNNVPIITTHVLCKAHTDQYLNEVTIVGNVGGEPKTTESGKSTKRSVALNRPFRNPGTGEMEERTHWFQVRGYGTTSAKLCDIDKGSLVEVTGSFEQMTNRGGESYCELKIRRLKVVRKSRKSSPAAGTTAVGYDQDAFSGAGDLDQDDWNT